jgi:hypothetical protein
MRSTNHEEWRKLHNEELNILNFSPNIVRVKILRRMSWGGGACNMYGGEERRIQGFGGETSGKETTRETQA